MFEFVAALPNTFIIGFVAGLLLIQGLLALTLIVTLRLARRENVEVTREMFGVLRKIEGLSASRREHLMRHYDKVLTDLSHRIPSAIAAQAGSKIFEAESKILSRLAELEPNLKDDPESKRRMDELIKSMETLEHMLVTISSDTVQKILIDARSDLFEETPRDHLSLAA